MAIFKKEKEVIELIIKHADTVEECLAVSLQTLQSYIQDYLTNAKKLAHKSDDIETKADIIRRQIRDKLYYGAYMPILREDIFRLVVTLDNVANAAETCCDVFLNQRPAVPKKFKSDFEKIIDASLGVGKPLKHAVLCYLQGICPIEVSRQHSKDIGLSESKVDAMERKLTKKIFSSSLKYSHKNHLRLCLEKIVDVSDRAEDSSEQLDIVILKSMI